MRWIYQLIDKVVFFIAALCGMQIPEFIQQYRQRLGGHLAEAESHLAGYQGLADESFGGDIRQLTQVFLAKSDETVRRTGEFVLDLVNRVEYLKSSSSGLNDADLLDQMLYLATRIDRDIAMATLQQYKPGVPLTYDAAIYALFLGLIASLIVSAFRWVIMTVFSLFLPSRSAS